MQDDGWHPIVLPFPPDYRASGILAHVTSLPAGYGIGDLGPTARQWVDRLHAAGQSWWQALPLGPTGYGYSPYVAPDATPSQSPGRSSPSSTRSSGLISSSLAAKEDRGW